MYAIKPCGTAAIIGSTIESYAIGIGMRWRESNCTILEKRPNPNYETKILNRCLITKQTIKLLVDLGCSERKIAGILSPAKSWRIVTCDGVVLQSSSKFPSSSLDEQCYHCSKGQLLRMLRTEFLRFGGSIEWSTTAHSIYDISEKSVRISKTYGLSSDLEAVISTAEFPKGHKKSSTTIENKIEISCGVVAQNDALATRIFGSSSDVSIISSNLVAAHCWLLPTKQISWKVIQTVPPNENPTQLPDILVQLLQASETKNNWSLEIPSSLPLPSESSKRFCLLGDGLLPVDIFEFRGDNAHQMIREASSLCKELYGVKYHRGNVSKIFPQFTNEVLSKRKNLFLRDYGDLETFSNYSPCFFAPNEKNHHLQ